MNATTRSPAVTPRAQGGGAACDIVRERAAIERGERLVLAGEVQRGCPRPHVAQGVLGEIHLGAGKPLRARHVPPPQHRRARRRRADLEVVPHRGPERVEVGDRPGAQGFVIGARHTTLGREPAHETGDDSALDAGPRRLPQQIAFLQHRSPVSVSVSSRVSSLSQAHVALPRRASVPAAHRVPPVTLARHVHPHPCSPHSCCWRGLGFPRDARSATSALAALACGGVAVLANRTLVSLIEHGPLPDCAARTARSGRLRRRSNGAPGASHDPSGSSAHPLR